MKIDKTVAKETVYIAACVFSMSIIMQLVFIIIGKWDYTVLLGNLMSFVLGVGNFFLMGITVQSAVNKEKKQMENTVKISQTLRLILIFIVAAIGITAPIFNVWAVIIPIFFPRLAVFIRPFFNNANGGSENDGK
ncbi:MAG: hypothetical protein II802_01715 [Clostridia bacterium]|nr:hypothetical protein [Clostridia bacterium]